MVKHKRSNLLCALTASTMLVFGTGISQAAVTFQWATVGAPGNTADAEVMNDGTSGYGSVGHVYRISKYEVTHTQYAEFLNAVDPTGTNSLGLYNGNIGVSGISLTSGNTDGSKYVVRAGNETQPVGAVTFYNTLRFANWLHNGQGNGDTETGAYTLLGGTPVPSSANSITRNTTANVFLPSEDEWYKAAYYNPATNSYFDYATSSNTVPTAVAPPGGSNSASYSGAGGRTSVGAYTNSVSPFGTFDQTGNVWEWNETLISGTLRGIRGGSFPNGADILPASFRLIGGTPPTTQGVAIGFRVASTVPEPTSLAILALGSLALIRRRETKLDKFNHSIHDVVR